MHANLIYTKRRFQVLQDENDIHINFAAYGPKYLSYLKGGSSEETDIESFRRIYEVRPFSTSRLGDMKRLAPVLLALTLRAIEDEKEELSKGTKDEELPFR